nr:immunoglobulin heavy chain junction region [Macaca mulatta]MPN70752.1 immunoglobulin heavy chain junction region [Macaca mulatta]MPN70939.1 immunoglobulin heavy chain junction region [Macaca mulatta]MPN72814.1 immunoglobulin heavy chain junction region [Macaca mulatta]MPN73309.1 immunoglobulin heavy chain junction region [Macaca mulatta]
CARDRGSWNEEGFVDSW